MHDTGIIQEITCCEIYVKIHQLLLKNFFNGCTIKEKVKRGIIMELAKQNIFLDYILNFKVKCVDSTTRFWMIRTKKGYFYNDFVINKFVGLGWNLIDKNTDFGEQSIETLKELVSKNYKDKVPANAINKCKHFIYDIKIGDILIIPSAKTKFVTFAVAGDYYEDDTKTYEDEEKLDLSTAEHGNIKCPYRKRRKIEIIKTVRTIDVNHNLFKAITNYHGISNLDSYSKYILDSIYEVYSFGNMFSLQIGVNTEKPIKARDISRLMNGLTEYMCSFINDNNLSITLNLNSPGKISLIYQEKKGEDEDNEKKKPKEDIDKLALAKKIFDETIKKGTICIGLLIAITGGKFGEFELKGVFGTIKEVKMMDVEVAIKAQELEAEKLENVEKKIQIYKELKESDIDLDELEISINQILSVKDNLDLGISEGIGSVDSDTIAAELEAENEEPFEE